MIEPITAREMRINSARAIIAMANAAREMLAEECASPDMHGEAMLIIREVAGRHGITVSEIVGKNRSRHLAHPRQEAYALIRDRLGYSLPRIGMIFKRDHSTVLYGIRQYEKRRAG